MLGPDEFEIVCLLVLETDVEALAIDFGEALININELTWMGNIMIFQPVSLAVQCISGPSAAKPRDDGESQVCLRVLR